MFLKAFEIARGVKEGSFTASEVLQKCFDKIDETDSDICAWVCLDTDGAMERAKILDSIRKSGKALGPLHGVPVGIKDIVDTVNLPTSYGSDIFADRRPESPARIIELLEKAGAIIVGKTVTTEFAFMKPSITKNPVNINYSPGGSSSGSASAVAAGNLPIAIGSQTNGSVIRPASFCGVYAIKPSNGIIPKFGVLETSNILDQMGIFANCLEDLALACDALSDYDSRDPNSRPFPSPVLSIALSKAPPVEPKLVWLELDYLVNLDGAVRIGFDQIKDILGNRIENIDAREATKKLVAAHKTIYEYQLLENLGPINNQNPSKMNNLILEALSRAKSITYNDFKLALEIRAEALSFFEALFLDYDAILTPSAISEAPLLEENSTGDPICCTIWTLCGLPCFNIPLLSGEKSLPVGVQLVGKFEEDDRLIRTANWLQNFLTEKVADLNLPK